MVVRHRPSMQTFRHWCQSSSTLDLLVEVYLLCSANGITIVCPHWNKNETISVQHCRYLPSLKTRSASVLPEFVGFSNATAPSCLFSTCLANADCGTMYNIESCGWWPSYLYYICPVKAIYAVDPENPFLLREYYVIRDPEVTRWDSFRKRNAFVGRNLPLSFKSLVHTLDEGMDIFISSKVCYTNQRITWVCRRLTSCL